MTDTQIKTLSPLEIKNERIAELQEQVANLSLELSHYRSENKDLGWLQIKMVKQAKALTRLNKRVRFQRAMLRLLNEQHLDIADSIFQAAKAEMPLENGETITF